MFLLDTLNRYSKTDRVALVNREEQLTFAQLDARSDAFAAFLLEELGEDGIPILIYGEKETAFLVCMIGALKAGRGYVPIDRTVPLDRVEQITQDVRPRLVVDLGGFEITGPWRRVKAEELEDILSSGKTAGIEHHIGPDTPAYILFTSGSTGRPKGVAITPRNLEGFYNGILPWYPAEESGVMLHQISYSFDVSCCAVYVGLARGMTLFTVDHAMAADWGELFAALKESGLTLWVSTPSFAELCLGSSSFTADLLPCLSRFLFCGEVLTHTLCDALAQRFPGTVVVPVSEDEKVTYLAAFLLLKEPDGLTPLKRSIQLKKEAAAYLPGYMVPRRFIAVDAFPLNANGKVYKKTLAARLKGEPS